MNNDVRNKKNFQKKNNLISIIVVIAIIIILNLIFQKWYLRFDLTAGKIYSISDATKQIISNLPNPVTIKAFVSKDLPSPYNKAAEYLRDILSEYQSYSHHKITYEFIDPKAKPKYARMAREMGIMPVRINVMKKDKFEVVQGYLGLAIIYGTKKEVVPVITSVSDLEYIITSKIVKLQTKRQKKIGFLTGQQEIDFFSDAMNRRLQSLRDQYLLEKVKLKDKTSLNSDDLLVIAGPKSNFADTELYFIDRYIMKGKPVLFFLDGFDVSFKTFIASPISDNLFSLLRNYGVEVDTNSIIADMQNEQIAVSSQNGYFTVRNYLNYPYFLKVTDFNRRNAAVKGFRQLAVPFVSPIYFNKNMENDTNIKYTPLIFSSRNAFAYSGRSLNPYLRLKVPNKNQLKQFIISAEVRGALPSYFSKNSLSPKKQGFISKSKNSRFIIMSTSGILSERFFNKQDINLLSNMIDYMVQDQRLIRIRSKGIHYSILKSIPNGVKILLKYINMFLISIFLILYGLLRWEKIRKKRENSDD